MKSDHHDFRSGQGVRVAGRHKLATRRGFTLADLVVTVLIIGIMAAVAAPKFGDVIAGFRAEAAARRIAADVNYGRHKARTGGKSQAINFSLASNSYTLPGVADLDHGAETYGVDLDKTGYPATIISIDFDGNDSVTFDRYGHPFSGSPLAPLGSGSVVVESGPEQRTISIHPTTGEASVQ